MRLHRTASPSPDFTSFSSRYAACWRISLATPKLCGSTQVSYDWHYKFNSFLRTYFMGIEENLDIELFSPSLSKRLIAPLLLARHTVVVAVHFHAGAVFQEEFSLLA